MLKHFLPAFLALSLAFSACSVSSVSSVDASSIEASSAPTVISYTPKKPAKPVEAPWYLILVNPTNKIPADFSTKFKTLANGQKVDARIYKSLSKMLSDAAKDGISLFVCSGYRTKERSKILFDRQVKLWRNQGYTKKQALKEAARWVAPPGTSEHHTGLACDIVTPNYQSLDFDFSKTDAAKWLKKNCAKYGFILRYPENKQKETGIGFEPWHFRFVGKKAAAVIMKKGICLEEYLE